MLSEKKDTTYITQPHKFFFLVANAETIFKKKITINLIIKHNQKKKKIAYIYKKR